MANMATATEAETEPDMASICRLGGRRGLIERRCGAERWQEGQGGGGSSGCKELAHTQGASGEKVWFELGTDSRLWCERVRLDQESKVVHLRKCETFQNTNEFQGVAAVA